MMFFALIALIYIAYMLGKEDGRWGLLIGIGIVFLIGFIMAQVK